MMNYMIPAPDEQGVLTGDALTDHQENSEGKRRLV
jgi:hypothetical protein